MKRSRFSEEQITYALRQAEDGTAVPDVCRQLGISAATFYGWKKRFAHLDDIALALSRAPCRPIAYQSPDRFTQALFRNAREQPPAE